LVHQGLVATCRRVVAARFGGAEGLLLLSQEVMGMLLARGTALRVGVSVCEELPCFGEHISGECVTAMLAVPSGSRSPPAPP